MQSTVYVLVEGIESDANITLYNTDFYQSIEEAQEDAIKINLSKLKNHLIDPDDINVEDEEVKNDLYNLSKYVAEKYVDANPPLEWVTVWTCNLNKSAPRPTIISDSTIKEFRKIMDSKIDSADGPSEYQHYCELRDIFEYTLANNIKSLQEYKK